MTKTEAVKEILEEVRGLPEKQLGEVITYIEFIKARQVIDPAQAYFWTRKWQEMERRAEVDKKKGRILGNGTTKGLIKALRQ